MSVGNLFWKVVGFFTPKKEKEPEVQEETITREELIELTEAPQPTVYNHRRKTRNHESNT